MTTTVNTSETTFEGWESNNIDYATSHGTHVAGTIAARDKNNSELSALGVAPSANIYTYRVLGPGGRGPNDGILAAIEQVTIDKPDVVNMSLGSSVNDAFYPTSLAINNAVIQNPEITFVVAAGNDGPSAASVGSPGTSAATITVANASLSTETHTMTIGFEGTSYDMSLFYIDTNSEFLKDNNTGKFYSTYEDLIPINNNYGYKVIKMPKISEVEGSVPDLGTGTAEEFEAIQDIIEGNIVVVSRGSEFAETARIAKEYKVGAVILVDRPGETLGFEYRGRDEGYLPFFTIDYSNGVVLTNNITDTENIIYLDNFRETTSPTLLNATSSRGPVLSTYEIKPGLGD